MSAPASHLQSRYTWSDYQALPEGGRWELIGGKAYSMSPSPHLKHQDVLGNLYYALRPFFAKSPCTLRLAPTDVKLSEMDCVQPDLLVVCDPRQEKGTHIEGPPSLVVEVLSPATASHDRARKFHLYAASGVPEYWIVDVEEALVEVFVLRDGVYTLPKVYARNDTLKSPGFSQITIALAEIFPAPHVSLRMVKEAPMPEAAALATSRGAP